MLKLQDVVAKLKDTYKSIELCVACGYHQEKWINVLTVIRFSCDETAVLDEKIQKRPELSSLQKGNRIRLFRIAKPFADFDKLVEDLGKGFVPIDKTTVHFESTEIKSFDMYLNRSNSPSDRWGYFYCLRDRKHVPPYDKAEFFDSMRSELIPYGGGDIFQAIREYFDVSEYNSNYNLDFVITAPIYARIKDMFLEGKKIKIVVSYHKKFNILYLHYTRNNRFQTQKPFTRQSHTFNGDSTLKEDFINSDVTVDEIELVGQTYDNVTSEADLFLESLPDSVSSYSRYLTEMIADKKMLQTNPLAMAFVKFCSFDNLTELLLKPSPGGKDNFKLSETDNFERVVYWLFALQGFQAIWLGKDYETLFDENNRRYSADLICYNEKEKTLAVVSCKTSVPKVNDIDLVKNLADKFSIDYKDLGIKVTPIIVSSESCDAIKQNFSKLNIVIIDANDIRNILSNIHGNSPNPRLLLQKPDEDVSTALGYGNYYGGLS